MFRFLTLIIVVLASLVAQADQVTVTGVAEGREGMIVRLLTYADQVSYKKLTLAAGRIEAGGAFSLTADIPATTYALIDLDFRQAEIFLVPGAVYSLLIDAGNSGSQSAYYDRPPLEFSLLQQDKGRLNESIGNINQVYNDFLVNNAHLLQSSGRTARVEAVKEQMKSMAGPASDPYLSDYLKYKMASLDLFMRTSSRENLAAAYLTGQPVLYGHVEYMDFFHLFFEKYLLTNNRYLPYSVTSGLINGTAGREEILREFGKDPVLSDACLAELVLLAGLKEMAGMTGFQQQRILAILGEIASGSECRENRNIAVNLLERLQWMKPGTAAPDFELQRLQGGSKTLADYHGRYLYLCFIDLGSPASLAEMNLLADVHAKYKDRIAFAAIVAQGLTPGWSQLARDYRMSWDLLSAAGEIGLIEQYGAAALPVFVLIDPQGKIYRYPAPSPSEDLEGLLGSF